MEEEKKRVQYTDPDGHVQDGWAIGGHIYQDEEGTLPMPVGSTYVAPDGKVYTKTASGGQFAGMQGAMFDLQSDPYYKQMQQVMEKIERNEPFSFDLDTDRLYQQYKNQYTKEGELAMKDTMGQAAALTGGYGSTYAETAAQQAYQAYLDKLNDKVPELYAQAYKAHNDAQDALYDKWKLLSGMVSQDRDFFDDQTKAAYDLAMLSLKAGVMPEASLLNRAGIDPDTAASMQAYYSAKTAGKSGGTGRGGSGSGSKDDDLTQDDQLPAGTGLSADEMEEVKRAIRAAANEGNWRLVHQLYAQAAQTATDAQIAILEKIINGYGNQN